MSENDAAPGGNRGRTNDTTIEADHLTIDDIRSSSAMGILDALYKNAMNRSVVDAALAQKNIENLRLLGYDDSGLTPPDGLPHPDPLDDEGRKELRRLRARHAAAAVLDAERAGTVVVPAVDNLQRLLAEPDEDETYRVNRLWPAGGRVVFYAQKKTGKTTAVANLVRAIVDGTPVFDMFEVTPFDGSVTIVDTELSRNMLRRWYRTQGIDRTDRIDLYPLRGQVAAFNILNPTIRSTWAALLRARNTRILILDCLRPTLDALGLSEDKDFGQFAVAFDALLHEADVDEAIIVHHAGHNGDRMRGDSRIGDWADANWRLALDKPGDPFSLRTFSVEGRDVLEPARAMAYDSDTRHLMIAGGSTVRERALDAACDAVRAAFSESGRAMSRRQLEPAALEVAKRDGGDVTRARIREAIDHLDTIGALTRTNGPRRLQLYELGAEPAETQPFHPLTTADGGPV